MIKRFVRYYRPHISLFFIDMICALTISVIDLIFPIVTSKALRDYIPDANLKMLYIAGAVLLSIYVIRFVLSYIIGYWGHVMGIRIETDMRTDLSKKFQTLDYQFYDDKKTG
ncbi:MAG TPA: ABC transporter transmembrane domain-containing protein, partial [Bacilli bacterium]